MYLPLSSSLTDKGSKVSARGQRSHVSSRRLIGKCRGMHNHPGQNTCPHNFLDTAMLSQDVTENERAQNVFKKSPIVPHNLWFATNPKPDWSALGHPSVPTRLTREDHEVALSLTC